MKEKSKATSPKKKPVLIGVRVEQEIADRLIELARIEDRSLSKFAARKLAEACK